MGDFNSLCQEDAARVKYIGSPFTVIEKINHPQVIPLVIGAGFIDAGKMGGPTAPTKMLVAKISLPFLRLDYIFHTLQLKMSNFQVFKNSFFNSVSDHFPIGANICP